MLRESPRCGKQSYGISARIEVNFTVTILHDYKDISSAINSGSDYMGHRREGHVPPLLQMAGHGDTVSRRTANKKLTKLY